MTSRKNTNQNAARILSLRSPRQQYAHAWEPTTGKELRAYIGVYIWMGIYRSSEVDEFWNTDSTLGPIHVGPIHDAVRQHISRNRWQQLERFFHITPPQVPTSDSTPQTPFDKLEPLDEHLCQTFKEYWKTGTHLAVDETIQRFPGRAKQTVKMPSKPVPIGFKIWVLANSGYVLDWMWHAKGDGITEGPQDLDPLWTED